VQEPRKPHCIESISKVHPSSGGYTRHLDCCIFCPTQFTPHSTPHHSEQKQKIPFNTSPTLLRNNTFFSVKYWLIRCSDLSGLSDKLCWGVNADWNRELARGSYDLTINVDVPRSQRAIKGGLLRRIEYR